MKTRSVSLSLLLAVGLLGPRAALAQVQDPYMGNVPSTPQTQQEYLGDDDYDPDIDDYDASQQVYYDNTAAAEYDDGYDPNAYTQFESALSPYGQWVDDGAWGRVWVPSASYVGYDFSPYASGGHWTLTEYGWTWVSDWDWGWAPFHYGRWATIGGYGWCWIPGTQWGPAWVSWRNGGGYVGWAPMPPRGVVIGPPSGVRHPWHFVVASNLGARNPTYLPSHVLPAVFSRTSVVANSRAIAVAGGSTRINMGPTGVGRTLTPVRLGDVAPRALPHPQITPRPGMAVQQRPWVRAGAVGANGVGVPAHALPQGGLQQRPAFTRQPSTLYPSTNPSYPTPRSSYQAPAPRPMYQAPTYQRPMSQAPGYQAAPRPMYQAPAYQAPRPMYQAPGYQAAPRPMYQAPAYQAPRPTYSAPSYSAPSYSRPSYSAPSYSAPHPTYSAPSRPSYSAPHPSYSAPAAHFSAPSGGHHR